MSSRSLFVLSLLFLSFLINTISAQLNDDRVLAKVGDEVITVGEFTRRYELVPHISSNIEGLDEVNKYKILYTLIAEKLWAQEAERLGYDTTDVMKYTFSTLEKMYARDALFKEDIQSKVRIDPKEVSEAVARSRYTLKVNYLVSTDPMEINMLYNRLLEGVAFDSLLAKRPESRLQAQPYTVQYGQMDKVVEDSLFSLEPGEYTHPVEAPHGWYIFKLLERDEKVFSSADEYASAEKDAKKIVEKETLQKEYKKFFTGFFAGKEIDTDGYLFWTFADGVIKALEDRKAQSKVEPGEAIALEPDDFEKIKSSIGPDSLDMVFIKLDKKPVTLRNFLHEFFFENFSTKTTNADTVRAMLNNRVKRYIEHEMLAREAVARGLDKDPETAREVEIWRDYYLSAQLGMDFFKSVKTGDEEARKYYEENDKSVMLPAEVNIVEVLTDSLDVVEKVLAEVKNGADMHLLAREHSIRPETKDTDGEFGFFPVTSHGEIGETAANLKVGEVYGPLKTEEGYSVFKVIGKKEKQSSAGKDFGEVSKEVKSKLESQKLKNLKIQKTVELADKYDVNIDKNLLRNINVTNFSMLVYKYFGFGGKTLAVPLVPPFIEWVDEWQNKEKILP